METASPSPNRRPVAPGLFTEEDAPSLIGGRSRADGRLVFPCPTGSAGADYEPVTLGRRGRLWSYTVQRFRPKSPPYAGPVTFEPYAVGYVELPGEIIVEARLAGVRFEELRIGLPLQLRIEPFAEDPDGTLVMTYAFAPSMEDLP